MRPDWTAAMDLRPADPSTPLPLPNCVLHVWGITIEPGHMWEPNWSAHSRLVLREYTDGRITLERGEIWPEGA